MTPRSHHAMPMRPQGKPAFARSQGDDANVVAHTAAALAAFEESLCMVAEHAERKAAVQEAMPASSATSGRGWIPKVRQADVTDHARVAFSVRKAAGRGGIGMRDAQAKCS